MIELATKLSDKLKSEFAKADEIWVAVGLLNEVGLNFILKAIPKTCKRNFIVGVNLPTEPKALSTLFSLKVKEKITASILTNDFFHPKVYIAKTGRNLIAYVGSANCTNGGLKDNIEMSIQTEDKEICSNLISWFEKTLLPNARPLTSDFIKDYKPIYDNRMKRKSQDIKEMSDFKRKDKRKLQAEIEYSANLISELKKQRRASNYDEIRRGRQRQIKELRADLDYPRFTNFDFTTFFTNKGFLRPELGTLPAILIKSVILNNTKQFTQLLKLICDESIPLAKRINEAMDGKYSLDNIKDAFISKVLIAHNPKQYYVHNKLFINSLKPFGLSVSPELNFGEKYELTRDILKQKIMLQTNITDFATLDALMI